jgi:hypothetical protein
MTVQVDIYSVTLLCLSCFQAGCDTGPSGPVAFYRVEVFGYGRMSMGLTAQGELQWLVGWAGGWVGVGCNGFLDSGEL